MKKRWKLLLTLGLALVAVSLLLVVGVAQYPYPTLPDNMVQAHKDSGDLTTEQCVKCHGDKRVEATGVNQKDWYSAHKRHNMSVYLRFNLPTPFDNDGDGVWDEDWPDGVSNDDDNGDTVIDSDDLIDEDWVEPECAKCHQSTEISAGGILTNERTEGQYPAHGYDSNYRREYPRRWGGNEGTDIDGNATTSSWVASKQVDPAFCVSCHGGFTIAPSPTKQGQQTQKHLVNGGPQTLADVDPRGCLKCHRTGLSGDPTPEHRLVPYVNTRYAATSISCLKCHGLYKWYDVPEMNYLQGFSTNDPDATYWPQP